MSTKPRRLRRALVTGAVVAGAGLGTAGIASAATSSTTTAPPSGSSTTTAPAGGSTTAPAGGAAPTMPPGPPGNPATMTHGPNETLLTGADLQKATAAATAAVPGATVIRAETDSSGASPYEVHMKKADGTYVTVELNSSFAAITTVPGFGAGPAGSHTPVGPPPSSTPTN